MSQCQEITEAERAKIRELKIQNQVYRAKIEELKRVLDLIDCLLSEIPGTGMSHRQKNTLVKVVQNQINKIKYSFNFLGDEF